MAKLRGVNLGNWLVLEKWMNPKLFEGTTAEDETDFCAQLGDERFARLKAHRDTYITLKDFEFIRDCGLNAVRIPVPHFIFDDYAPYVGCIEYLDRAFEWANRTGIKILIDLHTVRDSQNGFDNGGICGVCKWHLKQENIDHTVSVLKMLACRYKGNNALYGIEFLNEPITDEMFRHIKQRYIATDAKRAEGSCGVPDDVLRSFYTRCYRELRAILDDDTALVFHDGFRLDHWKDFMREPEFKNVVLDSHPYVGFAASALENPSLADVLDISLNKMAEALTEMSKYFPIMIGEWCYSFPENAYTADMNPVMRDAMICASAACQTYVFERADSWFYWSYKLISEPQGWDFRKALANGWVPKLK